MAWATQRRIAADPSLFGRENIDVALERFEERARLSKPKGWSSRSQMANVLMPFTASVTIKRAGYGIWEMHRPQRNGADEIVEVHVMVSDRLKVERDTQRIIADGRRSLSISTNLGALTVASALLIGDVVWLLLAVAWLVATGVAAAYTDALVDRLTDDLRVFNRDFHAADPARWPFAVNPSDIDAHSQNRVAGGTSTVTTE